MRLPVGEIVVSYITLVAYFPEHNYLLSDLVMEQITIESVDIYICLSLTINKNMTWTNHVDQIALTIPRSIVIINRIKYTLPMILTLHYSFILPYINISMLSLGNQQYKITKLQKKAIQAIIRSRYLAHTQPFFNAHLHCSGLFNLNYFVSSILGATMRHFNPNVI